MYAPLYDMKKVYNSMSKYLKALDLSVGTDMLETPFIVGTMVVATNGEWLAAIDKSKLTEDEISLFSAEATKAVKDILTFVPNMQNTYTIELLNDHFKKVPLVEDFDEEEISTNCEDCDGEGEVEFAYEGRDGKEHTRSCDCPVCDGYGKITEMIKKKNGKFVLDHKSICRFGNSTFYIRIIKHILDVAKILDETEFTHIHQTGPNKPSIFKVGDITLVLMPMLNTGDKDTCFELL